MTNRKYRDVSGMVNILRSRLGLTQEQFAAKVGVTWATVNRPENGWSKPAPLAMSCIAEINSSTNNSSRIHK
jgi:putative transcriptional regulator